MKCLTCGKDAILSSYPVNFCLSKAYIICPNCGIQTYCYEATTKEMAELKAIHEWTIIMKVMTSK